MTEAIDYAARVQRGAALLDEKWPTWATDVDLGRLDIEDGYRCMTAQYAQRQDPGFNWAHGRELLGLNRLAYEGHGFKADDADEGTAYPTLNALWRSLILQRRSAAQSPEVTEQ